MLQKKALQELVQIVQIVFQVSKQWCLGPLLCLKLTGSTFCSAAKKTAKRVKCDILARSWSEWWRDKERARKEEGVAQGRHQLSHNAKKSKIFSNISTHFILYILWVYICATILQWGGF